jgi:23S rRNA (uracil-5-)-methyltransferase RumA
MSQPLCPQPVCLQPPCPYFNKCGGCTAQHIPYEIQLENKKKSLLTALGSGFSADRVKVFSGEEYHYRNRMDFIFHNSGLGFRKKGEWKTIIDIEECPISNLKLNALLGEVRDFFKAPDAFNVKNHAGTLRYAVIRAPTKSSSVSFVLSPESNRINEAIEKIREFSKTTTADNVLITYAPPDTDVSISDDFFAVKGSDTLKEILFGKEFSFSAQGFFQNNTAMAEKMHEYVSALLSSRVSETKSSHLLDLYGGVGAFGIINAPLFKSVTIVEEVKQCIDAANLNIKQNNTLNAKAVVLDAKQLNRLELPENLFVITDPPRSGMHPNTIKHLNRLRPKTIIYVSCNLTQLGKDIPKFQNYKIKSAALFDLFPQTVHCESIVELEII